MPSYIDAPCPLCHDETSIVVRLTDGCDSIQFVTNTCACSADELLSGPFDEVVVEVTEWRRNCYPYAINGERSTVEKRD